MQKIKSLKFQNLFGLTKCCLIGVVTTLIGTLIFAFILKFTNLPGSLISYVNNFIKAASLFIAISCAKKREGKLIFKALMIGVLYAFFTFIIFSILNGSINFDVNFVFDMIFAVVTSVILAVIINLLSKKTI